MFLLKNKLTFCLLIFLVLLLNYGFVYGSYYSTADLEGKWNGSFLTSGYEYNDDDWIGWGHGEWQFDSNGKFNAKVITSSGESRQVNGSFSVSNNGIITSEDYPSIHGVLNQNKNLAVFTMDDRGGGYKLTILTKPASSYETSDLEGEWNECFLTSGYESDDDWIGWGHGEWQFDSNGNFHATEITSSAEGRQLDGSLSISDNGIITSEDYPSIYGALNQNKTVAVFTMDDEDGGYKLAILTKPGSYYKTSDLAGIWQGHFLTSGYESDLDWSGWGHGEWEFGSNGNFNATVKTSSDDTKDVNGSFSISPNGIISSEDFSSVYGVLRQNKNIAFLIRSAESGGYNLGILFDTNICTYSISPSYKYFDSSNGTQLVSINTDYLGCRWSVSNNLDWVNVSPPNGTGSGNTTISVETNTGESRSGDITIAESSFDIHQYAGPCNHAIDPTNATFDSSGGTQDVSISADHSDCYWTVSNNLDWVNVSTDSGIGQEGSTSVFVSSNNASSRNDTLTIADIPFDINQGGGGSCSYSITPTSASFDASSGSQGVSINASSSDCNWIVSNTPDWISVSKSRGTGKGDTTISVDTNWRSFRSETITIAKNSFEISQEAVCSYSLSSTSASFAAGGESQVVTIDASSSDCDWKISNIPDWVSVSPTSGTGSESVTITVESHSGASSRKGTIYIARDPFYITQEAYCDCSLSFTSASFAASGGSQEVTIDAPSSDCNWSVSNVPDWVSISTTSDTGDGSATITVESNSGSSRSETVTIAGESFDITQEAAPCSYSLSSSSASFAASEGSHDVSIQATHHGCSWSVSNTPDWVSVSPTSGTGSESVTITVESNSGSSARNETITIAGESFDITQEAATCSYSISPTNANNIASFDASGENQDVYIDATHSWCTWSVSNIPDWVSVSPTSGTGDGSVTISPDSYDGSSARNETITIAGKSFGITQEAGSGNDGGEGLGCIMNPDSSGGMSWLLLLTIPAVMLIRRIRV